MLNWIILKKTVLTLTLCIAQSIETVEHIDCLSAEGSDPPMSVLIYDTKQSDGQVPAMRELWEMRSAPSLPLIPGPLWPGMVAPDRTNCILMLNWIVWIRTVWLNGIVWNRNVFYN